MLGVNSEVKKVLFIVNKFSGTGYQPAVEGRITDVCAAHDVECTIEFTRARGHATELARQGVQQHFDWIVGVGGDGTINEVARGMVGTGVPMGIIPKGSGNGLGRHLGIPVTIGPALDSLFKSQPMPMDTFTINGHLSLNVSGIGFDGHIANLFGKDKKRGLAGYVKLTVGEFFSFREFGFTLHIDGQTLPRKAFIMAIANSSQYGNNARIAPAASVCDGLLHLSILKKVPPYRVDFIYAFFTGNVHQSSYCEVIETQSFSITTPTPISYHIDGEPSGTASQFDIQLNPCSLVMLVPPQSRAV